tara:strand:- start:1859 stop:2605 length:747 start_codon:yes stop_codon:yes gene_type:complete
MKLKKKSLKVKKKTKKKPYFGKDAHNAIVRYQECECRKEKNKIYFEEIKPSFEKLAENLIFIHGFSSSKEDFHIIKSDCVSFLYEILEKFDPSKGSKAFSYFNICAKHYLIIQSKKKAKNRNRNVSINDDNLNSLEKEMIENYQVIPSQEDVIILREDKSTLKEILLLVEQKCSNKNEKLCSKAIISVFDKIEDLDFLNKRAIFVYLRELSGLNAKQLSIAMSNLRKYYREIIKSNDRYFIFKNSDIL